MGTGAGAHVCTRQGHTDAVAGLVVGTECLLSLGRTESAEHTGTSGVLEWALPDLQGNAPGAKPRAIPLLKGTAGNRARGITCIQVRC
jgi:hypothetical protein